MTPSNHMGDRARARAILAITLGLIVPLQACAPGRADRPALFDESFAHALAPAASVEHATPGRALVIPLRAPASTTDAPPSVFASIDGGDPIPGAIYRLIPPSPDADPWLGGVGAWRALPAGADEPSEVTSIGVWVAVLVIPPEARPASITINARIVRLRWLEPPARSTDSAWSQIPQSLERFLATVRNDPTQRWRERLIRERLVAPPSRDPPLSHPALELLALQTEDRWRAGLQRLRQTCGESLADAALRSLTAFVMSRDGPIFPVWPTDAVATSSLLDALLDETLTASALESRVRAYLAAFPPATAWMRDDAGSPSGAIVGLADLSGAASAATLAWRAAPNFRPEMIALSAFSTQSVPLHGAADAIDARIGTWTTTLPTLAIPIAARPPGVTLGPLRADHTLESWRSGAEHAAIPSAAALLRPAIAASGWELYLQCSGAPAKDEFVRIYLGPTDAPTHILRVTPDGSLIDERSPVTSSRIVLAKHDAGWSAIIPIPASGVGASEDPLLIAIERVDARSRRSAWPRALLPWQAAPGRAAVDLSAWRAP